MQMLAINDVGEGLYKRLESQVFQKVLDSNCFSLILIDSNCFLLLIDFM